MLKGLATFLATAFLLVACTKDKTERQHGTKFIGTWQWERTVGGIAGHIHDTPQSTGQTIELTLTQDNKYTITTNGTVSSEGTYSLSTRKCIHECLDKPFIDFSEAPDRMAEFVEGNKLRLSDEAADGLLSHYKRKDAATD